jgi:hypothetical protein
MGAQHNGTPQYSSDPELAGRLPDFVVIGTMKSGSTTLYRWLERHPGCALPAIKEPNFFAHDTAWRRGLEWYADLFAAVDDQHVTGEASVTYTDPRYAATAASRLRDTAPAARLVCLLRHPVERLRSHYRHELQRGRERRPFGVAVTEPGNPYVARSRYAACLEPWVRHFPPAQLCVVRLEDLVGDDGATWERVLTHLGLTLVARPDEVFNVTGDKAQFTGLMRLLWERGALPNSRRLPQPLRRVGRRLLLRNGGRYAARTAGAADALPDDVVAPVWEDVARLPTLVGDVSLSW